MSIPIKGQPIPVRQAVERANEQFVAEEKRAIVAKQQQASTALSTPSNNTMAEEIQRVLLSGDVGKLNADQRLHYYKQVCESLGLNPLTKPFDFLALSDGRGGKKVVMYAGKECAAQLSRIHGVSVKILKIEVFPDQGFAECHVEAKTADGRVMDEIGAIPYSHKLTGEAACNARMKLVTKAKRRATLSICGLGMMDETEVETIQGATKISIDEPAAIAPKPRAKPQPLKTPEIPFGENEHKKEEAKTDGETGKSEVVEGVVVEESGVDQRLFDFGEIANRQRLVKEIRNRFPGITQSLTIQIGEQFKGEQYKTWDDVMMRLNEFHAEQRKNPASPFFGATV